jgi:hypothetical protein
MDGGAVPYRSACGCADLPDRPAAGCLSGQEDLPRIALGWVAGADGVSSWPQAPAPSETNLVELWLLLPEHEKQELGAVFSRMVMKLFRAVSNDKG